MPPLLDEGEFTKLLRKSKQEPVNFTFGLGKGPENHQLAFHRKKEGKPLFEMLKKEADGITKGTWGTVTSDAKSITVNYEKEIPSLLKNLKLFLKINGLKLKPIIIGPDGAQLADDDDGADDAAIEEAANAALKRQLTGALKKIVPIVQKLLKADPGRKQDLMTPLAAAKKALDAEAYDDARKSVKTLIAAISTKPGAAPKAEPTADDTDLDEDELSDADDDVAKLLDPDVFVKLLRKSKREPVPFAFGLAGDPESHALAFHRKKEGKPLFTMLKQQADGVTKGTWGMAESDAKSLTLTIEKEVPALYKNVKLFLKAKGLKLKPIIKLADGSELPDDEAATEVETVQVAGAVDVGGAAARAKAKAIYDATHPRVKAAIDEYADGTIADRVADAAKMLKEAEQLAKNDEYAEAVPLMSALDDETQKYAMLTATERNAEGECKTEYKRLVTAIKEYQGLDAARQDKKVIKEVATELKTIQGHQDEKRFNSALILISLRLKSMEEARLVAMADPGTMSKADAKEKLPKMKRAELEREQALAAQDLEVRMQAETLGEELGSDIRDLMVEHRNKIGPEARCFKGYRWMDDVLAITDEKARKDDLLAMNDAIQEANARQLRMYLAIRNAKSGGPSEEALQEAEQFARGMLSHIPDYWIAEGKRLEKRLPMLLLPDQEREKAKQEAMDIPEKQRDDEAALFKEVIEHGSLKGVDRTQFFFDEPLRAIQRDTPDERAIAKIGEGKSLLAEYQALDEEEQDEEFLHEMTAMIASAETMATDAQAKLKKRSTKGEPDPAITNDLLQATRAAEEAIKLIREELKGANVEPTTKDAGSQYERLMKTYDEMIQRAYKIHDAGGTVTEVESSLQHVPPEFWPPMFIENLQAWRKVERELADERVAAMFEKEKFTFDDAKDCLDAALSMLSTLAASSDLHAEVSKAKTGDINASGWMDVPEAAKFVQAYIEEARNGYGLGEDGVKALVAIDFKNLDAKQVEKLLVGVGEAGKTLISCVTGVPGLDQASKFVVEAIPILGAIAAGIDLTLAINELRNAINMRMKTSKMIDKAEMEYYGGEMKDGGAMVRAIKNERDARDRQVGKKTTSVVSKSTTMAGEVTKAAVGAGLGAEQVAGQALVIAGSAIEYGGKIVFAGIDWSVAKQAKALMTQAQAGNPIAQLEIMEKSGLYAKMYIAILAKDGHKLATEFVIQRGYDDAALASPATSLQILREAMLDHAEQKDETKVSDNLGGAVAEEMLGGGVMKAARMAGKGMKKVGKKIKDIPKDLKVEYNPQWKADPKNPKFPDSIQNWSENKANCIGAGLYDESSGIGKALKPCPDAVTTANAAIKKLTATTTATERKEVIAEVRAAQATLMKAFDVVGSYHPVTNDGGLHEAMATHLTELRQLLGTESNKLDDLLTQKGAIKADWEPVAYPPTSADGWKTNWANAVERCDLPESDQGVGAALAAYEDLADSDLLRNPDPARKKEIRAARTKVRDHLRAAGLGVKKLWSSCTAFPGMTNYLDEMITYIIAKSQANDDALNGFDWDDCPAGDFRANPAVFTSVTWKATYDAAVKEGFVNEEAKDCGMQKALAAWEKHDMAKAPGVIKKTVKATDLPKKRKEGRQLLVAVAKSAEAMAANNPDSHSDFREYIAWMRRTAQEKIATLSKEEAETKFQATKGIDKASWKRTYDAAIAKGAIPANAKAFKTLDATLSALDKHRTAMAKHAKAGKAKDAYVEANLAKAAAAKVQKALAQVAGTEGWANNHLDSYFSFVRTEVHKLINTVPAEPTEDSGKGKKGQEKELVGEVDAVLKGVDVSWTAPKFTFDNKKGWQVVKKDAIEHGLLADTKSGFGAAIKNYKRSRDSLEKLESGKRKAKDAKLKAAKDLVVSRLATIKGLAGELSKQTKNGSLIGYFKQAMDECDKATKALS